MQRFFILWPRALVQRFLLRDLVASVILQMCRLLTEVKRPVGSSLSFIGEPRFLWTLPNALMQQRKYTHTQCKLAF